MDRTRIIPSHRPTRGRWATLPGLEAIVLVFIGLGFICFHKPEFAAISWILAAPLSLSRQALTRELQDGVRHLADLMVIHDQIIYHPSLIDFVNNYLAIEEPEFAKLKDAVVANANEHISLMSHRKRSNQLHTGNYYDWLLSYIKQTKPGHSIWAISTMLDLEWIESAEEIEFLRDNINAASRDVNVERIFIVPQSSVQNLLANKGIKAHYDNRSNHLVSKIVIREVLESRDPDLLRRIGKGLIAFDRRAAVIDDVDFEGIRGVITLDPSEITRLRQTYDELSTFAAVLETLIETTDSPDTHTKENAK